MVITTVFVALFKLGNFALSWLPVHQAIAWPGFAFLVPVFGWFGVFDRFVSVDSFMTVLVLTLGFEFALMLYSAYRAILGLIPMFK
jgi:hypothetical protein